jgi:transposase InsO family protein
MSKARLVITAVVIEGRSQAEVARDCGVSKGWVSKLVARYRDEGEAAFEPRSRRPHRSPTAIAAETVALIVELRTGLVDQGLDAGCDTIAWHLEHDHGIGVSTSSIHRYLTAAGLIEPEPKKRPKSSYIRFNAEMPNQCWQSDFTHWRLADGTDIEILAWIDDYSRLVLSLSAHSRVTGPIVVDTFRAAIESHGSPASTLTDNGLVYTTRFSGGGRGGLNGFEKELRKRRIIQKNSRPNHPTTCGKVERFHATVKQWLAHQQPAADRVELQAQLDTFVELYNHHRPHRAHPRKATPAAAYTARPKATPGDGTSDPDLRVRHDRIDNYGRVTLRHDGRLHHIGIGLAHTRTPVVLLIAELDIRVLDATTGELLRHLTLDPTRDYQPTGRPPGPPRKPRNP